MDNRLTRIQKLAEQDMDAAIDLHDYFDRHFERMFKVAQPKVHSIHGGVIVLIATHPDHVQAVGCHHFITLEQGKWVNERWDVNNMINSANGEFVWIHFMTD